MFTQMRRGWDLTKKSWGVVRAHPGLVRLPVRGGLLALFAMVLFAGPGGAMLATDGSDVTRQVTGGVLVAIGAYLAWFAVIFHNVALAAAVDQALTGSPADLRAARRSARARIVVIAGWALVSVMVSVLLAFVRDRGGAAGGIVTAIGGTIWSLVTFLVVPVLAFEGIGPVAAAKRSASLLRQRWGQQVTGDLAIGGFAGIAIVLGILLGGTGVVVLASDGATAGMAGAVLLAVGVVVVIAAAVFAGATRGVFGVVLYHFVTDADTIGPFTYTELDSAVRAG